MQLSVFSSRKKMIIIFILIILISSGLTIIYSIKSDECRFEIYLRNSRGQPIEGAITTIWIWYPGLPSKLVAIAKSDSKGVVGFKVSWSKLLGVWMDRYKKGMREEIGLIVNIYDKENSTVTTKVIPITVKMNSPGMLRKTLIIKNSVKIPRQNKFKGQNNKNRLAYYTPIVEESKEYRRRTNLAYVKTDSNTVAWLDYCIANGDKTRVRLLFGYTYSDYTIISDETIYVCKHEIKKTVSAFADRSSTAWYQ